MRATLQRAQVVGHFAELPDQLGIAEIAGRRVSRPAERHRPDVAGLRKSASARITAAMPIEGKKAKEAPAKKAAARPQRKSA